MIHTILLAIENEIERKAVEDIYYRFYDKIKAKAYEILRNHQDAEDVSMMVFEKISNEPQEYIHLDDKHLANTLRRITINQAIDFQRHTEGTTPMENEVFTNPNETVGSTEATVATDTTTNVNSNSNSSAAGVENADTEASTEATEPSSPSPLPEPEPSPQPNPTTIEKKAVATYMPSGYSAQVELDYEWLYSIGFTSAESHYFSLIQTPIVQELSWMNSEYQTVSKVFVHEFAAVLAQEKQSTDNYSLTWQAYGYEFNISGIFSDVNELIKIAESVQI